MIIWIPLALILLTGCKVGPIYHQPQNNMPAHFQENKCSQACDDRLFQWWKLFQDPSLDQLLAETVKGNFDLKIAIERIFQARAAYWVQFTEILPEFISDAQATRFRISRAFINNTLNPLLNPTQNFFQTGFDAVWQIDLFGKLRRAADGAFDLYQASEEDARNVAIAVLSEAAKTYMAIRSTQQKLSLTSALVEVDQTLEELAMARLLAGLGDEQEVQAAKANLETDQAQLISLEIALKQTIYSLSVLTGKTPECLRQEFSLQQPIPCALGQIPLGVPADLLRRRHDIRSAERQLAAATEQIGVAVADLFPSINLIGSSSSYAANPLQGANIGWSSDHISELFSRKSLIWGIGSLVTWPVFDFGNRCSAVKVQRFLCNQAFHNYQKTVITALQEVEQALVAYYREQDRQKALSQEAEANKRALDLNLSLYECGLADYTLVLQSKETWLSSLNNLTDSQEALAVNLIAVYKSLGGDWTCF
jgi:outer membrane protein, multidrug efflux system